MAGKDVPLHGAFERCRNCGAELAPGKDQCPACNTAQRGTRAQSASFGRKVTWAIIGVLLLVVTNLYYPYITPYLRPVWPIRFAPLVGEAISRLNRNRDALKLLGSSVQHGWFVRGYIRSFNDELGAAQFRFIVRGSRGIGAVRARLVRIEDTWAFSQLIFEPENGAPVNLLNATDDPPQEKFTLQKDIYLVPVGTLPDLGLSDLPGFYKNKFGLNIVVLPSIPLEPSVQDGERGQLIAEEIVTLLQRRLPQLAKNQNAVVIGITNHDMYFRERNWCFTYTYWDGDRGGAVSSARFHATRDTSNSLLKIRTRKMISRVIGMLALKLPRNEDLTSVLARELYGSFSADLMSDEFDGLGSLAMVDNFRSAHWLPSFPPKIIAEKVSFDVNLADGGSYPCLI
ncbi:MAG: cytochrome c oxidase assembly factor Coa1 family protein, partial [Candidatus Binatia bacterium]